MAFNLMWYIITIWLELTAIVVVGIAGMLFVGYRIRMARILHILRVQFIVHYILVEKRIQTGIVLQKELVTYGGVRFIKDGNFYYKVKRDKIFFDGYDLAIAHRHNHPEPLDITESSDALFSTDKQMTGATSAQETDGAINAKVVSDLNKSMYTTRDTIMLIALGFVGVISSIGVYLAYENSQQMTTILQCLAGKIVGC